MLVYVFLNNAASVAVNIFALISGYLGAGRRTSRKKVLGLWGTAVFWSVSLALTGLLGGSEPGPWLYRSIFPVLTSRYWYLSSYLVMQLLLSFVQEGVERMERRRMGRLAAALVAACSILGFIRYDNRAGIGINNGYSVMWLTVLWVAGAAIKRNKDLIARYSRPVVLGALVLVIPVVLTAFELRDIAVGVEPHRWVAYVSPLLVLDSLCCFLLCQKTRCVPANAEKGLVLLSGSAFGVYLIDTSSWFYDVWLVGRFAWIGELPLALGLLMLLGITFLMYMTFLLLETVRRKLVAALKGLAQA
ncbi:acyltransferase family protein [uncultured Parolsenella sp.]|uniref:acyltransferase family protein n=1 Tax=uncultured Parolsenella sp. TaxID=2083008 RepID=UPI002805D773|nr:acyltransferase family protein [uncultured Parolsenella sp.]